MDLLQALYQIAVLLVFNFDGKRIFQLHNESREHADKIKNTFVFNAFVFCQIFNEFNARKPEEKNVFGGVTSNRLFMGIVGITTVLQILIIEFLGKFFGTVRLGWKLWLLSVAIGAVRYTQENSIVETKHFFLLYKRLFCDMLISYIQISIALGICARIFVILFWVLIFNTLMAINYPLRTGKE
uniref:Cation-transporting P-type ATPase C-terminal domain-containing protein n=1 Tax=Aegilops tauschii subsp. strangulata TaxID=200361 RepID=A0A453L6L1_AEGTS